MARTPKSIPEIHEIKKNLVNGNPTEGTLRTILECLDSMETQNALNTKQSFERRRKVDCLEDTIFDYDDMRRVLYQIVKKHINHGSEYTVETLSRMGWIFNGLSQNLYEVLFLCFFHFQHSKLTEIFRLAEGGDVQCQEILTLPKMKVTWESWRNVVESDWKTMNWRIGSFIHWQMKLVMYEFHTTEMTEELRRDASIFARELIQPNCIGTAKKLHALLMVLCERFQSGNPIININIVGARIQKVTFDSTHDDRLYPFLNIPNPEGIDSRCWMCREGGSRAFPQNWFD
tara:strand:- start:507 stop:1370 length:864 start_codon:yes stop_codon:yes gene_type:complete